MVSLEAAYNWRQKSFPSPAGVFLSESTIHEALLRFGAFELDLRSGELRKGGVLLNLPPQPFKILVLLATHPGQLVTREKIQREIWGSGTFVDFEQGLNFAINKIRMTLGDEAGTPRYIETLPRRGYRFIAPVEETRAHGSLLEQRLHEPGATLQPSAREGPQEAALPARIGSTEHTSGSAASEGTVHEAQSATANQGTLRWRTGLALAALLTVCIAAGLFIWHGTRFQTAQAGPVQIHSLAVLPLANLSGDPSQDYFADGMTDELTTNLAKIRSLLVISRTTMMQYRDAHKPLPQIAEELHVDAVVEGSVVCSGSTVRITAQLIDARHDHHLWAQSYERQVTEILSVQDSVALDIASAVKAELGPEEHESLARHRSIKPDAYESYLRGRSKLGKQAPDAIKDSLQDFRRAIDQDPLYAPAYSGLADAYSLLANYGALPPQEAFPPAKAAALKALSLDPSLAEAHASLAFVKNHYDWDWTGAEREYKRAIELSPSDAIAHLRYARYLSYLARFDEAIAEIKHAQELDPLSLVIQNNVGIVLYYARRYDAAILESRKTLEIDPDRVWSRVFLALSYEQKGMYREAIQEQERVKAYFKGAPTVGLAHVYALSGRSSEARLILRELEKEDGYDWLSIAADYAALGEKDRAFHWLEKAYEEHDFFLPTLAVNPWMDPLRSDPRFRDLLRRIGLPR